MEFLNPKGWQRPRGYSNGVKARGTMVAIAGQVGWNGDQRFEADDFAGQARQAMANIVAVLAEAGGRPEHLVRMTWYVVDKQEYLGAVRDIGAAYREIIGSHYPAMTLVEVKGLLEDRARVEIEAAAILPDGD